MTLPKQQMLKSMNITCQRILLQMLSFFMVVSCHFCHKNHNTNDDDNTNNHNTLIAYNIMPNDISVKMYVNDVHTTATATTIAATDTTDTDYQDMTVQNKCPFVCLYKMKCTGLRIHLFLLFLLSVVVVMIVVVEEKKSAAQRRTYAMN